MPRTTVLAAALAVAVLTLSSCGSDEPAAGAGPTQVLVAPGTILSSNHTAQLGVTVVDGNLNTLYRFDRDTADPSTATCTDECAATWPPMLTDPSKPPVLEGLEESVVGTVNRPDGTTQVTVGGWPVYTYSGDQASAATDGNGKDGAWFAVTPTGGKAKKAGT